MIIGIGNDLIEIARIEKSIKNNPRFIERIYTKAEIAYCSKKQGFGSYAVRFAAKEAVAKAIGTGIGEHCSWKDVEVFTDELGNPELNIADSVRNYLGGNIKFHISLTHEKTHAVATAIIERLD